MDLFGNKKIERRFYHYQDWEDFKLGMYNPIKRTESEETYSKMAISLLSDPKSLKEEMTNVLNGWVVASDNVLSNTSCNRKAWLGQSACFYKYRVPEHITRSIWFTLSEQQREDANNVAQEVIDIYESEYDIRDAKKILK